MKQKTMKVLQQPDQSLKEIPAYSSSPFFDKRQSRLFGRDNNNASTTNLVDSRQFFNHTIIANHQESSGFGRNNGLTGGIPYQRDKFSQTIMVCPKD